MTKVVDALPAQMPNRGQDDAVFVPCMDALFAALPALQTQINESAVEMSANANSAAVSAQQAAAAKAAATSAAAATALDAVSAQAAAAAAQAAAGLPAPRAGRVLRSPDGVHVEFGHPDGEVLYVDTPRQIPLGRTILANSVRGTLELTTPSNPQIGDWFVVADQGNAQTNNIVIRRAGANLFSAPEDFTDAAWIKTAGITVNANGGQIAPDGTSTADVINFSGAAVGGGIYQDIAVTQSPSPYTQSIYVCANSAGQIEFQDSQSGSAITVTLTPGWQRVSLSHVASALNSRRGMWLRKLANTPAEVQLWGAKLELGDAATFYDPVTPSTNLLRWSDVLDDASWGKIRASVSANSAVAPDGTLTADKIIPDAINDSHCVIMGGCTPIPARQYPCSVYLRADGFRFAMLDCIMGGVDCGVYFDLEAGTSGTLFGGASNARMSDEGDGWFRCSFTTPAMTSGAAGWLYLFTAAQNGQFVHLGDGVSGIHAWRAQIELGVVLTPAIQTTSAAASRAAGIPTRIMGAQDDIAIRRNYWAGRFTYQGECKGWVLR